MKNIILLVIIVSLLSGCSTIAHKDIETEWQGLGVSVQYKSTVAIDPDQIPAFIDAVDRLEQLLGGDECQTLHQQPKGY